MHVTAANILLSLLTKAQVRQLDLEIKEPTAMHTDVS